MATAVIMAGFMSGTFISNTLALLELKPQYLCTDDVTKLEYICTPLEFCGTDIVHRVDYEYYASLHNWVDTLDLECTPKAQIGLIGSIFFAGWAFAATFVPRLSDLYGRRVVFMISMTFHFLVYSGIILSHNFTLTIVLMFLLGMASVGRATIGYLYLIDMTPVKQQTMTGTSLLAVNTTCAVFACLYFHYISKQWQWFYLVGVAFNLVSVVATYFLPESPKYLHSQGKWSELRVSMNVIAKVNRAPPLSGRFDREKINGGVFNVLNGTST